MFGADLQYDRMDGGTIMNGKVAPAIVKRFAPTGPMPILIAKDPIAAPLPGGTMLAPEGSMITHYAEDFLGPAPTTKGGTPVITQPAGAIPSSPDEVPWWKRIATAIVPQSSANGVFGPEDGSGFGPSFEPSQSAAGDVQPAGAVQAGFGNIPPQVMTLAAIGLGLYLLSRIK